MVGNNAIEAEGGKAIAELLKVNNGLSELDLRIIKR